MGITDADVNHTGDATLLRKVNESAVLEQIRRHGPLTRSQVARQLHLSLPTITRIANELLNAGLIVESSTPGPAAAGGLDCLHSMPAPTSSLASMWDTRWSRRWRT